jgi:hypothetical protein
VAEWGAQPFNKAGWGGLPVDMTVTVEKDKANLCLQVGFRVLRFQGSGMRVQS